MGKEIYVTQSLQPTLEPHPCKKKWEEAVLNSLSLKNSFFFNDLPFDSFKESIIKKESMNIEKKLHLWRLELLYKLILENLDSIENIERSKGQLNEKN